MTAQEYVNWLNNPYQLTEEAATSLKDLINEYPYLQSARALYLKTLHAKRSFLYNNELKKTAAYTTDRDVLFDYIVSEDFITYKPLNLEGIDVYDEAYIEIKKPEPTLDETIEKRVLETLVYIENQDKETELIHKIDQISKLKIEAKQERADALIQTEAQNKAEVSEIAQKLDIGTPLEFSNTDKFSFNEWLKLTQTPIIQRESEEIDSQNEIYSDEIQEDLNGKVEENKKSLIPEKQKKMDLIDRFIETNPKITPSKTAIIPTVHLDRSEEDEPYYMTETLARIYLEQKKYQKAIQAYEILILKYPEKSSLFANRIFEIKKLQEFNNI